MLNQTLAKRNTWSPALGCLLLLLIPAAASAQTKGGAERDSKVVAVIDQKYVITQKDVDDSLGPKLGELEAQIYALRKNALESLITDRLLKETAKSKGLTVEQLKNSFLPEKVNITPLQVEEEYAKHAQSMGEMDEDEARQRIRVELEGLEKIRVYKAALASLRGAASVDVQLREPASKIILSGAGPTKGPNTAPVQIVEFSDFQCPYCKKANSLVGQVLKDYGPKVQFVYKHLPLAMHPDAFAAAQASVCAGDQGKFWEFHDRLFETTDLSVEALKKYAGELSLDVAGFNKCLESESSRSAVLKDLAEARRANVEGTPTFFINGKQARGVGSVEDLKRLIDAELGNAVAGNEAR
jgi:protein-disulfide isomerase